MGLASLTDGLNPDSWADCSIFLERLHSALHAGLIEKIEPQRVIWHAEEDWYRDQSTGEIYVYRQADPPLLPRWANTADYAPLEASKGDIETYGLSGIKEGRMNYETSRSLKFLLMRMDAQGKADDPPGGDKAGRPRWLDTRTGAVYQLRTEKETNTFVWERVTED